MASIFTQLIVLLLLWMKMVVEGMPITRKYDFHHDIISGNDFLSLFLDSNERDYAESTVPSTKSSQEFSTKIIPVDNKGMKVSVMMSSSEEIHTKTTESTVTETQTGTETETETEMVTTTPMEVTDSILSEEYPSLIAESNKSEFSVDESEPITSNQNVFDEYSPAEIQQVPVPNHVDFLQNLPNVEKWEGERKERQERHYLNKNSANQFEKATEKVEMIKNPLPKVYGQPEENYEVDEAVSVMTNGRTHGIQPVQSSSTLSQKNDNQKVGYVVEGRNYRKYRVEERTSDGFIVGEYGVVSHNDGSLRGVRYTADGTINPRLIYDALMKFLSL